jgi:hypothetical protein
MAGCKAEGMELGRETKEELDTVRLDFVWQKAGEIQTRKRCNSIKTRCNSIHRDMRLAEMRKKKLLPLYEEIIVYKGNNLTEIGRLLFSGM